MPENTLTSAVGDAVMLSPYIIGVITAALVIARNLGGSLLESVLLAGFVSLVVTYAAAQATTLAAIRLDARRRNSGGDSA